MHEFKNNNNFKGTNMHVKECRVNFFCIEPLFVNCFFFIISHDAQVRLICHFCIY